MINKETVNQQIEDLLKVQSGLQITSESGEQIELTGEISVNCKAKGYAISKKYLVRIVIPIASYKLPYVIDIGNHISRDYHHRYKDGMLCLETDTYIRVRFVEGLSLVEWMREIVEPYYFSYEFFQRYGEFPFGERGHNLQGVMETYQEFFNEKEPKIVFMLMKSISEDTYRGHSLCPCGSGRKMRYCHGAFVMKYYMDNRLNEIVRSDYKNIINFLVSKYEL